MLRYLLLIGVAAGVAAYFLVLRPELVKTEEDLGAIASQIAGRPVAIECQGVISHAIDVTNREGEVEFNPSGEPGDTAELKRDICKRLGSFPDTELDSRYECLTSATDCPKEIVSRVTAVHALSHESWHLAGVKDERITECYAMQTDELVATRLGVSSRLGRAIAVYYATQIYPHLSTTYRSHSCRTGGRYDLNAGSRAWP